MKKINVLFLMAGVLALTGCDAVGETFRIGEFHTDEFLDNYYHHMPAKYLTTEYQEEVIDLTNKVFFAAPYENIFNKIILNDIGRNITLEEAVALYGDSATKNLKESDYTSIVNFHEAQINKLSTSSLASWYNYAKYNSLTTGNYSENVKKAFKKGVFSKLTDTLILCDGRGSLVRIQIDEGGIGQVFAHELINYRNFVFSARGGTNIDYSSLGVKRVSKAKINLNISFYIEKSTTSSAKKITLAFEVPELEVDNNAITTVMSVDLVEALKNTGLSLERVSGMSVDFELLEHDYLMPGGVSINDPDHEFALMLYEVMFPYSTWR